MLVARRGRRARGRAGLGGPRHRHGDGRSSRSSPTPELLFLADTAVKPIQALDNRRFVQRAERKLGEIAPLAIGITGSFGKTTTKACVAAVAELRGPAYATPASFNTLPRRGPRHQRGAHDEAPDASSPRWAPTGAATSPSCASWSIPRIGMLTAIGPAHLERFGSLDEIEQAKGELAEALPADGTFVTSADDERCLRAAERTAARVVLFSTRGGAGTRS